MKRLTIGHCHKIAQKNGGKYLGINYINTKIFEKWECSNKHIFQTTYDKVRTGYWCPECAGNKRLTIKHCHKAAKRHNGECLSTKYINIDTKYSWRCEHSHQWEATYHNINNGTWCPYCSGRKGNTTKHCHDLAKNKNGYFLGGHYKKSHTKYLWECSKGHRWEAKFLKIKQGTWCPLCKYKTQTFIFDTCTGLFPNYNIKYNFRDFDWLKTSKNGRLELDIYIPELKLAIEYDGQQHFYPVKFDQKMTDERAEQQLKITQQRDELKNEKIKKHPKDVKHFLRFNYKESLNEEYIINKINLELHDKI